MIAAGIDIGSRTIKSVVMRNNDIVESKILDSGTDPLTVANQLLDGLNIDRLVATGYGRHLAGAHFNAEKVTEIKAHAIGARYFFPGCRTVIDIGGQDSKVIAIGEDGNLGNFTMNDRCAAGTGRFLEIMAKALGFEMEGFGAQALDAERSVKINSMCTVFAESEVISLISKREPRRNIALGIHVSIVSRVVSMAKRIGFREDVVFTGGVAMNQCIRRLLEETIGVPLYISENPQIVGALGAALVAASI